MGPINRRRLFGLLAAAPLAVTAAPVGTRVRTFDRARLLREFAGTPVQVALAEGEHQRSEWAGIWLDLVQRQVEADGGTARDAEAIAPSIVSSRSPAGRPHRWYDADDMVWVDDDNREIIRVPLEAWLATAEPDDDQGDEERLRPSPPPSGAIALQPLDAVRLAAVAPDRIAADLDDSVEHLAVDRAALAEIGQQGEDHRQRDLAVVGSPCRYHEDLRRACCNDDGEGGPVRHSSAASVRSTGSGA